MSNPVLSSLILPVKSGNTVTNIQYDLPSGGGGGASTPEAIGFGYGTCDTAYITTEKAVTLSGYVLTKNGIVAVHFTNAVPASATLNINSTGAKAIYHKGAALASNVIGQGDTATFIYDGTYFQLISLDRTLAKATTTSVGSATEGTAIDADDITSWSAGTAASVTVSGETATFTNGTAPALNYTAKTIPNISVSSETVVTGIS